MENNNKKSVYQCDKMDVKTFKKHSKNIQKTFKKIFKSYMETR